MPAAKVRTENIEAEVAANPASPGVVVGLDGSRAAAQAASWALDEAVARDIPLCLLHAIPETGNERNNAAAEVAAAENTVRSAIASIESSGKGAKLEAEIVHRHPVAALVEASRSATMICVGSIGFKHATGGRIGSTASALAVSAECPVAVVPRTAGCASGRTGLVLAVVDGSSSSDTVLELGVAEARLRDASLRVLTQRKRPRGRRGADTLLDNRVAAELDRRVMRWRRKHPSLDIESVCDYNGLLNYLEHLQRNATPIQVVVVDPRRPGPVDVLLGPSGRAVLESAGATVMICDRKWWL